ncbi:hypothetical protein EIP86_006361 [Pleurotus ostreatoroseus]|nr:hypothetical protein EIP86_006361 [Pleurotus ostreatoroseus]
MRHVSNSLPLNSQVLATATVRVYHRPFKARPENWTYLGLRGTMVFGRNRFLASAGSQSSVGSAGSIEETVWFRLIDPTKGLIWLHQVPNVFDYTQDKPFFHHFSGKSRMFGFVFDDDSEAAAFLKIVSSNVNIKAFTSRKKTDKHAPKRLSPSMVSLPAPGTFVHVAHVGFDSDGRLETSQGISSEWTSLLEKLEEHGVPRRVVEKDHDFASGLMTDIKAVSDSSRSDTAIIPTEGAFGAPYSYFLLD